MGWIAITFGADMRGAQKVNPNHFVDPLTFHRAPPGGQGFY